MTHAPTNQAVTSIILAATRRTRFENGRSEVLRELCGQPMIHYVVEAAIGAGASDVVVVVSAADGELTAYLSQAFGGCVRTVVQDEQLGTGNAVLCALPEVGQTELVYILRGDAPLLEAGELLTLHEALHDQAQATMLICEERVSTVHRQVVRDAAGSIVGIADPGNRTAATQVCEVDPCAYFYRAAALHNAIAQTKRKNDREHFDFGDVISLTAQLRTIVGVPTRVAARLLVVNDPVRLAAAEDALFVRIADTHRRAGANIHGCPRIDATVIIEPDAVVEHGAVLRGKTRIGSGARIDVGAILTDVMVAPRAVVRPYSICVSATIGEAAEVGPLSHVRPASHIGPNARIGNFVETKNVTVGRGAMANHLAYLGDGGIGDGATIGAGTIFCNSDGINKHRTEVGAGAFIGSDSQIVAPVSIGAGAIVATGTTVTRDVPPDALAIARVPQVNKEGYAPGLRERFRAEKIRRET